MVYWKLGMALIRLYDLCKLNLYRASKKMFAGCNVVSKHKTQITFLIHRHMRAVRTMLNYVL